MVAYNVAVGVFGGLAPFAATYLIAATNSAVNGVLVWIYACAIIGIPCWASMKERAKEKSLPT